MIPGRPGERAGVASIVAGVALLLGFWAVGAEYADGYALDLGSIAAPPPRHAFFLLFFTVLGGLAAGFIAVGLTGLLAEPGRQRRALDLWKRADDRTWIWVGAAVAFGVPLLIRTLVLRDAPLTDDESAYRFMAELLATGRLSADSPPGKLFFDRAFMVNDGTLYAKYFLGWPALLAPAVRAGVPGLANAFYAALAVPALASVLRRLVGGAWARAGIVLYVASPLLMIAAASELSHTSAFCALAWTLALALRSREPESPTWLWPALAAVFSLAFFVRPTAALGIGAPALAYALLGLRGRDPCERRRAVAGFVVPALLGAGLFLGVNAAQNGSPLTTGYARELAYAAENGFRFTNVTPEELARPPEFDFTAPPDEQLARTALALLRLNFAFLGWPCSLLFACLAGLGGAARLPWACLAGFLAIHFATHNSGIDSFGPVHFFEAALPLLLLSVVGLRRTTLALAPLGARGPVLPAAVCAASIAVALSAYVPVRLDALARIAANVRMPFDRIERAGLRDAVVFASRPFAPPCRSAPTRHFVFWRPNNDPDLTNDVLWANHVDVPRNRELMAHFPARRGWVMLWTHDCEVRLLSLDDIEPGSIPAGYVGGLEAAAAGGGSSE